MIRLALWAILTLGASVASAHKDSAPTYDQISFDVSISEEIETDEVIAVVYHQVEGLKQAGLADQVNRVIAKAMQRAAQASTVASHTLQYQVWPIRDKLRITGWRARQSIQLESSDVAALVTLLGDLQEQLAVESIRYELSADRRRAAEARLTTAGIEAFTRRARLIADAYGRTRYRMVSVNISSQGFAAPRERSARIASFSDAVASPTIVPGRTSVTIHVSGSIELGVEP